MMQSSKPWVCFELLSFCLSYLPPCLLVAIYSYTLGECFDIELVIFTLEITSQCMFVYTRVGERRKKKVYFHVEHVDAFVCLVKYAHFMCNLVTASHTIYPLL